MAKLNKLFENSRLGENVKTLSKECDVERLSILVLPFILCRSKMLSPSCLLP